MTLDEVRTRVDEIRAVASDDESAHSKEDDLYEDVLRAVMEDDCEPSASDLAATALTTKAINFARWTA